MSEKLTLFGVVGSSCTVGGIKAVTDDSTPGIASWLLKVGTVLGVVGGWIFSGASRGSSRNSESGSTSGFKGTMPVHLNPEIAFSTVSAFR